MQDKLANAISRGMSSVRTTIQGWFTVEGGGRIATIALSRGATWAAATVTIFIALTAILESVAFGKADLGQVASIGALLGIGSAGATLNVVDSSLGLGENIPVFAEVGLHVTLATLILVIIAYKRGRKVTGLKTKNSTKAISVNALSTAIGFIAVLELVSLAIQGTVSLGTTTLTVSALTPANLAIAFFLIAVPSFIGGLVGRRKALGSSRASLSGWATRATLTFAISYSAVVVVVAVIYGIISWIQPDFQNSTPDTSASTVDVKAIVGTVLAVLAFLPTLLFTAFGLSIGGSLGITAQLGEGSSAIWGALTNQLGSTPVTSFSVFGSIGWAWELVVLGLVAAVSITSAVIASHRSGYAPRTLWDFVRVTAVVLGIAFVAQGLTQATISWSNHGQGAESFDQGAVFRDAGAAQYGITGISLALLAGLVALAASGAAKVLVPVITDAFPRLISLGSGIARRPGATRSLAGRVIGGVTAIVIVLAIAIPTVVASVERVWGSLDSPITAGSSLADKLQNSSIADSKALFGSATSSDWLDDQILSGAKPTKEWSRSVSATNNQKKEWQVGNLDALIGISWATSKAKVSWSLPTTSKLDTTWGLLRHAKYTSTPVPVDVVLSVGSLYPAALVNEIKVNGQTLTAGNYKGFPGVYHVEAPGYRLIGAVDAYVGSTGNSAQLSVGSTIVLPDSAETDVQDTLKAKAAKCSTISSVGASACFRGASVLKAATVTSGSAPDAFYAAKNGGFEATPANCKVKGADELVTASQMVRVFACTSEVTFRTTYTAVSERTGTRPTYSTYPGSCDFDWDWNWVCGPDIRIQTGTESFKIRTEGPVIATTNSKSTVSFEIRVNGTLDAKDVFHTS